MSRTRQIYQVLLRQCVLACVYAAVICISLLLSMFLRFDFSVPDKYWSGFQTTILWLLPLKLVVLFFCGQFRTLLTFFSLSDAKRVLFAIGVSGFLAVGIWHLADGRFVVPRGVILTDSILSFVGLVSLRIGMRVYRERFLDSASYSQTKRKRVAIIGAGSSGSALFREIQSKPGLGMDVVCFVDDDTSKIGGTLHGRKIVGKRSDLPALIAKWNMTRIIIAMPTASPAVIRETVEIAHHAGIEHDILPSVAQILHKQVLVSHLRHVEPEDLLGREPVLLDEKGISELIRGKVIMVTGAGGSIGSELCRQVAALRPSKILLIERSEPHLFQIEQELCSLSLQCSVECFASSVTQAQSMRDIFQRFQPEIIFHAAAHKHVPLMESQPIEAVLNNCYGTWVVAQLAEEYKAEKFILVSTDKAVNPTNVMGATKRFAELIISEIQTRQSGTCFSAVRFGNVLGSSGSVIPVFRSQISAGGPITVTHPEITRYFMSIPEAVGLVLQSAWQAHGGEVFILDMGNPIKIVDLAYQMIELSGLVPGRDIQITFTGLRPGEKLYEEPIHRNENSAQTVHPRILVLREQKPSVAGCMIDDLQALMVKMPSEASGEVKAWLTARIPEYHIWKS